MESDQKIKDGIKRLLGAVAHSNHPEVMKAYKVLYKIGPPVIPYLKESLFKLDFSQRTLHRSGAAMLYVTSLVSLIHDIDEEESKKVATQLIQNGCGKTIAVRLKSINEFTVNDYIRYKIRDVEIFEQKEIQTQYDIRSFLEKWLNNVPDSDLKEIERLYIVNRTVDQDYLGNYTPFFYNIKVVWDASHSRLNPVSWFELRVIELALYHEIGHHSHRHSEFGQVKEQEDQAEYYAGFTFVSARPFLFKSLSAIKWIVQLFKRKRKLRQTA